VDWLLSLISVSRPPAPVDLDLERLQLALERRKLDQVRGFCVPRQAYFNRSLIAFIVQLVQRSIWSR
jgi:hypothetical protein